jgi:hypothetical protein
MAYLLGTARAMLGAMNCPNCNTHLIDREPRGHAARYQCPKHGVFRVSHSSEELGFWRAPLAEQVLALKNGRANVAKGGEPMAVY